MGRTVIVGTSVAGVRTAQALRLEGHNGELVLVGAEDELPYDKPELSKGLLHGAISEEQNLLMSAEDAADIGIELRLGVAATGLDTVARRVELADRTSIAYDALVIATGSRARSSPWGELPGVHVLRSIAHARALGADVRAGGRLVIVGAGFIGSEVASSAVRLGTSVELIDPNPRPMARVVGPDMASVFHNLHVDNAVRTRFGVGVVAIGTDPGRTGPTGRPGLVVTLDDGTRIAADTVLVAIGAIPNSKWLEGSGLDIDAGVRCDEFLRVAGRPEIVAVGDVAHWWDPASGAHRRSEHWTSAVEQARVAAHNLVHPHQPRSFSFVEYVWSDQHGSRFQFLGRTGSPTHVVVPDPNDDGRFAVVYAADDKHLSGVMTVNWPKALIVARQMIAMRPALTDVTARLESLAAPTLAARAG